MNIKLVVFLLMAFCCSNQCFSKEVKMYIWEPNEYETKSVSHYTDTLYLSVIDDRELPEKSKINFSSEELVNYVFDAVCKSFPNAKVISTNDEKNCSNKTLFKIHIKVYCAIFNAKITAKDLFLSPIITGGSSKWYGTTQYFVETIDDSKGKKDVLEFLGEDSKKNSMGYSTAKKVLTNSFQTATENMINYLIMATSL
jgi:hypothetical protein